MALVRYEWDPEKNKRNLRKHGVRFSDAVPALEDERAITIVDNESDPFEERFVTLGLDASGRLLVVAYTYRDNETIRLISARKAEPHECEEYQQYESSI